MPVSLRSHTVATALVLAASASALPGQVPTVQDGRLPRQGAVWFELTPSFFSWSDQFALDSDLVADGSREPLAANFGGPITDRLYPGSAPFLLDINSDADALGYDPLAPSDLSFGALDYREISKQQRRFPFGLQIGILDRLSLEMTVPLVQTTSTSFFGYDTTAASVTAGTNVVPDPATFFGEFDDARSQLTDLITSGTLTPEELAQATALLANSSSFSSALQRRVMENLFTPVGSSTAGMQMAAMYDAFMAGYVGFGLALPQLSIPQNAAPSDLDALFGSAELDADPPGDVTRGLDVGELELGVRIGILNTFTSITRFDEFPSREPGAPADTEGAEEEGERPVELGETARRLARRPASVQFRTTVGVKLRLPLKDANGPPYLDPSNFLDVPIGNGQKDVEISFFQDVRVSNVFMLLASAYYGVQLSDDVDLRVGPPDQPFGLASTLSTVERDLGNYFAARFAPQLLISNVMALGAEYNFWHKGSDRYTLLVGGVPTADPLDVETSQTRHMLGVGAYYRTQDLWEDGRTGLPIEVAIIYQTAIAGSGGQTPAYQRFTIYLRLPAKIF